MEEKVTKKPKLENGVAVNGVQATNNVVNDAPVVPAQSNQKNGYIPVGEMTGKDIVALPTYYANLKVEKNKKTKQITRTLTIEFHKLLQVDIRLSLTDYNLILFQRKLNASNPIETFLVPARLLKGTNSDGHDWMRYEAFVSKTFKAKKFFTVNESALIEAANIALPFIESPDKFDKEFQRAQEDELDQDDFE